MRAPITTIAVAGAAGYVGSEIARAVTNSGRSLIPVLRGDSPEELFAQADAVIHAANPARRFQAEQNPERDFVETVDKTSRLLTAAGSKPFLLVSSLSCRTQLHLCYSRHRRACELMALAVGATVVRLGPMFGGSRTRDVLHDILTGRSVFVSAGSRYAYVDVAWAAQQIVGLMGTGAGIREIGARNGLRLDEIARRFASISSFQGDDDTQIPENCPEGPDASEVFEFAEREHVRLPARQ